jgi:hypothetical protein
VVREDPPIVLVAEDVDVLQRLLALRVVAQMPGQSFGLGAQAVKAALLEQHWADAVSAWIELTGVAIDVYPSGLELHGADDVDDDLSGVRIQFSPLFEA